MFIDDCEADVLPVLAMGDNNQEGLRLFRGDKSMMVTTDERMSSKIFIEFIAIIIRCRFYTYLRDKFEDGGSRPNRSTKPRP